MNPSRLVLAAWAAVLPASSLGAASQNMIGRQSQNEGLLVLPAPAHVTIDGDLKEWDWSGRIWSFADSSIRNRYSVETAAMWDRDNLYVALKWKDPTPMFSTVDPAFNPADGWKSDSVQIRLRTDQFSHVTTWYFTPKEMPVVQIDNGKGLENPFGGPGSFWVGKAHGTVLGRGIEMAYRKDADGQGYTQEIKLPWTLIYNTVPALKAGDKFQMGFEYLWGDPSGKTWPIHRYADNMHPGATSREFYFTSWQAWGDAELVDQGKVAVRQYRDEASRLAGSFPIILSIPKNAARVTVVIEDSRGQRVRNLGADLDPVDCTVETRDRLRTIEINWDCLDDQGRLVVPGTYKVRGLTHQGLSAEYEMCFYNPGTPPWAVQDGSGAWGADHSAPNGVAAAGEQMVVTWPFAEGGCGLIGLDATGQKKWGEKRGLSKVAADDWYVYGEVAASPSNAVLCRFAVKTGAYQPFMLEGKPRVFELPLQEVFAGQPPGRITGMAVQGGQLVLAMSQGKLAVLDATSARLLKQIEVPAPGDIAFAKNGQLFGIFDKKLQAVNLETGARSSMTTPDLGVAGAMAVDLDGNLLIADRGPDSQIKAYSLAGKLVYTAGKKGGRPIRGAFDEQTMVEMSSVAVDRQGRIWVVESWNYPRRVSIWGKDGKLVRDYLGNTGYAGANSYLHEQDPTLGYCGPMEFKLDKTTGNWKLTQVMWVPEASKGESFPLDTAANVIPQRFTSRASGKPHEYLYTHENGHAIFMQRSGQWQPVAAVCRVMDITGPIGAAPTGEMAGLDGSDGCFWNDLNGDGKVQRSECIIVPGKRNGQRGAEPFSVSDGWGGRIAPDLTFYSDGLLRFRLTGFSADGAPRYGPASMQTVGTQETGDLVPVLDEHLLLCLSFKGYADATTGMLGIDDRTGRMLWSYPNLYPGVHGSHRAPMPKPGLLIGPLKILGVAKVNDQVGNVFVMRGSLGQDFFMTTDGLFVGALFQDCRLPGAALPDHESLLKRMPMEGFSNGGEPFNGWFGKQADGKIRMTTGMAREACMILEVKGLESIRRFGGQSLSLDPATLTQAEADNTARAKVIAEPKKYAIKKLPIAPKLDGDVAQWKEVPGLAIRREGQPDQATAKLAYDATNLYVRFDVADSSPWRNEGKDYTRLFKTGDAVDVQLSTDPHARAHGAPQAGDLRLVFANFGGKPTAVLMMPVDKTAPADRQVKFNSPVGFKVFDRVEIVREAIVKVKTEGGRYIVEAAIPLKYLKLAPKPGMVLRGDLGFISSDAAGLINTARTYWSNQSVNLVNDLPLEAWLYPNTWSELTFE